MDNLAPKIRGRITKMVSRRTEVVNRTKMISKRTEMISRTKMSSKRSED